MKFLLCIVLGMSVPLMASNTYIPQTQQVSKKKAQPAEQPNARTEEQAPTDRAPASDSSPTLKVKKRGSVEGSDDGDSEYLGN